jgi:hypothetical protein
VAALISGAFLVLAVLGLAVGEYRLVSRLRRDHPETWQSLGSPSPWFTRWQDVSTVSDFLDSRGYERLGDPDLESLGRRMRILTKTVYALAGATLLLILLARLSARHSAQ